MRKSEKKSKKLRDSNRLITRVKIESEKESERQLESEMREIFSPWFVISMSENERIKQGA